MSYNKWYPRPKVGIEEQKEYKREYMQKRMKKYRKKHKKRQVITNDRRSGKS